MRFSLIPREELFFDLMVRSAQYILDGAVVIDDLARHYEDLETKIGRLETIEQACDEVSHITLSKLEKTFITPLDREDIHTLVIRLDDVLDTITRAAHRMIVFGVKSQRPPVMEFTRIIRAQAEMLREAMTKLHNPKLYTLIGNDCIEINRLENEADDLMKVVISELFSKETNAIELLRWKEIYETLEAVTDCGEDVAHIIHGIIMKMS